MRERLLLRIRHPYAAKFGILFCALLGVAAVLWSTTLGIGLSPDSVAYISAARNISQGQGLSFTTTDGRPEALTQYPPLLPALLAAVSLLGVEPLVGARLLNALLFGGTICLTGLVVYRYTCGTFFGPVLTSFFTLTSINMLVHYTAALTEPLFIFFSLLALFLLALHLRQSSSWLLAGAALATAASVLARYTGLAFVVSGAIGLFVLSRKAIWKRVVEALLFGLAGSLPGLVLIVRNMSFAGTVSGQVPVSLSYRSGRMLPKLHAGINAVSSWVLPDKVPASARLIGLVLVLGFLSYTLIFLWTRRDRPAGPVRMATCLPALPYLIVVSSICYVGLLGGALVLERQGGLDTRFLLIVYLFGLIVLACVFHGLSRPLSRERTLRVVLAGVIVSFAAMYAASATYWIIHKHAEGLGYSARRWQQSEIIRTIRDMPESCVIYTNGFDAVYILTGHLARGLPLVPRSSDPSLWSSYESRLASVARELAEGDAILVYFNAIHRRYYPSEQELREKMNLRTVKKTGDGAMYSTENNSEQRQTACGTIE